MCDLPKFEDVNLLVGFESSDDAAVYKLNEEQALIQTLDFFTPIVDDPYDFGQIAAANALSDVYAMGGKPVLALNIVGFPNCLSPLILKEIMKGGADKVKEAGALLVGGHSIEDNEPKYGLSVSGLVSPSKVWSNVGAKVGDVLILTKPIGTGVLTTALKENMLESETVKYITAIMAGLNKSAYEVLVNHTVHACTDITGFGLLGHSLEMAKGSDVSFEIDHKSVPLIKEAIPLAEMGIIPAGAYKNQSHVSRHLDMSEAVEEVYYDLFCDPQTSGGLLVSVPEPEADAIVSALEKNKTFAYAVIGRVVTYKSKHIKLY